MHDFKFKNNRLYCENVAVDELAEKFSTPLYVYSHKTITDHYLKLKRALSVLRPLICFSVKSNSNLSILRTLVKKGAGLDIVSGGELYRALKAGSDPSKIVYAGVGKTKEEITDAVRAGILFFNVESLQELSVISEVATRFKREVRACIRINPNIDPHTHKYITTGTIESKFGVDFDMARIIFLNRDNFTGVKVCGIHVHIGSQITEVGPFLATLKSVLKFIDELVSSGIKIEWLNIGGGLGIIYDKERPQTADEFASKVVPILKGRNLKIILEPGRFIMGNAGILVTKVLYLKDSPKKVFAVVDAGMNDLIRPSLYESYHEIAPVNKSGMSGDACSVKTDVVGPICESGDFLAKDRQLPCFEQGDLLAVMGAGAYGFSMSSNYNSRRRCAEVVVKGSRYFLVRSRETYNDLIRLEKSVDL